MASSNIVRSLSAVSADGNEGFGTLTKEKGGNRIEATTFPSTL
jgi:hypothetical protein